MQRVFQLLILGFSLFSPYGWAQAGEGSSPGGDAAFEVGLQAGNLLPNQIEGVTEIMGLGGARVGFRLSPATYLETGLIAGNGEGAQWKNAHVDIRMDMPIENFIGMAYVGADSVMFKGAGHGQQIVFGGHAGGGIQAHMSRIVWFRADMKFSASPGTSLYIGAGFVFRLGGGSGGGAD